MPCVATLRSPVYAVYDTVEHKEVTARTDSELKATILCTWANQTFNEPDRYTVLIIQPKVYS